MHRDIDKIKLNLNRLLGELINIAMEDSIISQDEQAILSSIKEDLDLLSHQLIQILQNDLDDLEFHDISSQIIYDIVKNVGKVAGKDGIITKDEGRLLDKLSQVLESGEIFK